MRKSLILLPLLLIGCTGHTRASYEQAAGLPILSEYQHPNGDLQVIYGPDYDPRIDFAGVYACPAGVRVAVFKDGMLVRKWFQADQEMPK